MRDNRRINSLMYHDLVDDGNTSASGFVGAAADRYKQSPELFEQHLDAIEARCAESQRAVGVDEALSSDASSCHWVATFDDGGVSAMDAGARLERRGGVGHFFVTTSRIGSAGFLTERQIRQLHEAGHVIGSHSHTHPAPISRLGDAQLLAEWQISVNILTDILQTPITVASVPGGYFSSRVAHAAEAAGIRTLFTSEPRSHVTTVGNCTVLGRYTILRQTPATVGAAFAAGDWRTCLRQRLTWDSKKLAKRVLGSVYHRSVCKAHELRRRTRTPGVAHA